MLSQSLQLLLADGCRRPRNLVGKADYGFIFFVKEFAAVVEDQRLNLFVSNANPLRRSGMRFSSILASINDRGLEISELLISLLQRTRAGDGGIKRKEILEHLRLDGQYSKEVWHAPEFLLHGLINRLQFF